MRVWVLFLSLLGVWGMAQAESVPLKPALTSDWLIYKPQQNQLVPYLPDYHEERQALYQWVTLDVHTNPVIEFSARQQLSIFLDNRLIFVAPASDSYTLDLSKYIKDKGKKHLLSLWHPVQQPNYQSFRMPEEQIASISPKEKAKLRFRVRQSESPRSALIIFLLIVGFIYGILRLTFYSDYVSLFKVTNFTKVSSLDEGLLAKPISSWSGILFVLAFALSFALLIVAIHTNIEELALFNQLFTVTQADLISKILLYTFVIFLFVISKYLFLRLMGFIFGVEEVVSNQYREFLRTLLSLGAFLPFIMLLYLGLSKSVPEVINWISNISMATLLVFTMFKTFHTVNKKYSLKNLHLFSYICATEVIPLMILLKLIVFV